MTYLQKKKLAFMSIVNKVKGFVRTITGALPLTLEGCVDEESIIDYTLYGQSVQNGTPTPETPVEVESVGEKTTNLINWDLLLGNATYPITKVDNGYYSTKYFNAFEKSSNLVKQIKSVLKPNTTYTLSRRYNGTRDGANGSIFIQNSASENIVECRRGEGLVKVTFALTQEQIDSIDHLYIYFHNNGGTITNLQLTESDTVLPCEPYGYKIPIKVSGKNLYNKNIDEKIVISALGTTRYGVKINSCNEPITVSGLYTRADFIAYKTIKDGIYSTYREMPILPHTITDTGDTLVLYLGAETSKFSESISNLQIEYGYTATDYEPYHETTTNIYLDEPLGEGQSINYKKDGLPTIPTFKGTSIISADTTIQPSNVEIEYYSNVKE